MGTKKELSDFMNKSSLRLGTGKYLWFRAYCVVFTAPVGLDF